ncbi:MAG: VWA domain-containing protein, partial [Verrucomicrobium sp.]
MVDPQHTETQLRFAGDWPALPVAGVAVGLALLMFFFYRRELRFHQGAPRWVLPLLRSLAVFLIVMCLAGPILEHVATFRQLGRVVIVADASASMSFSDELAVETPRPKTSTTQPVPQTKAAGSRFDRLQEALLNPNHSLVKKLAENHDVELFALRGYRTERLWWHRQEGRDVSGDLPHLFEFKPEATLTNLDRPLRDALGPNPEGTALVVLTDGQHNGPGSPEDLAASLRDSGIPIFTIGYGNEAPPPDLAILKVNTPEAVFAEGRVDGSIIVNDTLPAGMPAQVVIAQASKVLWQQAISTDGSG